MHEIFVGYVYFCPANVFFLLTYSLVLLRSSVTILLCIFYYVLFYKTLVWFVLETFDFSMAKKQTHVLET